MDDDRSFIDVERRFRTVTDRPSFERASVKERYKTGFAGSLCSRKKRRGGTRSGKEIASSHEFHSTPVSNGTGVAYTDSS